MDRITGVVLAGGRSSRFGADKAGAELLGRPLLQWVLDAMTAVCERVVIAASPGQELPPFEARIDVEVTVDLRATERRQRVRGDV
jgi:molybdopterin-guanine dinucleotide biosynthesis protein A